MWLDHMVRVEFVLCLASGYKDYFSISKNSSLLFNVLGSKNKKTVEIKEEIEGKMAAGGVHNPSNRLPAGEHF